MEDNHFDVERSHIRGWGGRRGGHPPKARQMPSISPLRRHVIYAAKYPSSSEKRRGQGVVPNSAIRSSRRRCLPLKPTVRPPRGGVPAPDRYGIAGARFFKISFTCDSLTFKVEATLAMV